MFFKKLIIIPISILWGCFFSQPVNAATLTKDSFNSEETIAKELDWKFDSSPNNLCSGYFAWPLQFKSSLSADSVFRWRADQTNYSLNTNNLILKGNVQVTYEDKQLSAQKAHVSSDKKTGKERWIHLQGSVRYKEPDKWIVAQEAQVDLFTKIITLYKVHYRLLVNSLSNTLHHHALSAWGTTQIAHKENKILDLQDATYTTCSPANCSWKLRAQSLHLDSKKGRGYAWHTRFYISRVPIFYLPYFSFPIKKRRESGFLFPTLEYSSSSGVGIGLPYYLNLAPNYDATLTPYFLKKRGLLINGLFRYLTQQSKGRFSFGIAPHDTEFRRFQEKAAQQYSLSPLLHSLEDRSVTRHSLAWQHDSQWNPHWFGQVNYNYVSDDYYVRDFSHELNLVNRQLLQQANINYTDETWSFLGKVQNYQTLHLIDEMQVLNQYARLPQLKLEGHWPAKNNPFDYAFNGEIVRFWESTSPDQPIRIPVGNRFSLRPAVGLPMERPFGYLYPRLQLQMTQYQIEQLPPHSPQHFNAHRIFPIVDVKAGLYFDRHFSWFEHSYRQTLEPVLYYLSIPYHNQDALPLFDTYLQPLNYDLLFSDNRFSGIDRINDAQQVALGISSRYIDDQSGHQKISLGIGQIYYFHSPKVMYCSDGDCSSHLDDKRHLSPLIGSLSYYFTPDWRLRANANWNSKINRFDYESFGFQYAPDSNHLFNVGYNFVKSVSITNLYSPAQSGIEQLDLSGYWKLDNRWSLVGRWNYNLNEDHNQAYLLGVGYESCCWAIRFMGARMFRSIATNGVNQYDHAFYIEIVFKGLGHLQNNNLKNFLSQSINGYVDSFGDL